MSDTRVTGATSGRVFVELSKYFLTQEYPSKLHQCIEALPEGALWTRSNDGSNSIGNLFIHLTGNVTEWIVGGVALKPVERNRSAEFEAREGAGAAELMARLDEALREVAVVLDGLSDADLTARRLIQDRETTVLGAIYHVVEHFAMHTGQIVLLTKVCAPNAIHFYDDSAPIAKPLWKRGDDVTKTSI